MLIERFDLSTPITIHSSDARLLTTALDTLAKGPVKSDNLWPGQRRELHSLILDPETSQKALSDLSNLRSIFRALSRLRLSLAVKIRSLEGPVKPAAFHHGMNNLPDEVMIDILKRTCSHLDDLHVDNERRVNCMIMRRVQLQRFSLVDRRFRRIVSAFPAFLTNTRILLNPSGESEVKGIQLGSNLGAGVEVGIRDFRDAVVEGVHYTSRRTLKRVRNWTSLIASDPRNSGLLCLKGKKAPCLPRLEEVTMDDIQELLKQIRLPSLKRLHTSDRPSSLWNIMPQLTTLSFSMKICRPTNVFELSSVLALGTRLVVLNLKFDFFPRFMHKEAAWDTQPATLEKLRTLSLETWIAHESFYKAGFFIIRSLSTPNLKTSKMILHYENCLGISPFPSEIFLPDCDYSFSIVFHQDPCHNAVETLVSTLLAQAPSITVFELSNAGSACVRRILRKTLWEKVNLKTLRLNNIGIEEGTVEALVLAVLEQVVASVDTLQISVRRIQEREEMVDEDEGKFEEIFRQLDTKTLTSIAKRRVDDREFITHYY